MKLKTITLASVFAVSSTLALAQGVGSVEVPITAPPGSGNGGSGSLAPGTPALEKAQNEAQQRMTTGVAKKPYNKKPHKKRTARKPSELGD
jgi:hypothetical protein